MILILIWITTTLWVGLAYYRPTFVAPKKWLFYALSFAWGLPMTVLGLVVALALILAGYKPKRFGWMLCFEFNIDWGVSLGLVMIAARGDGEGEWDLKAHEHGHALQNAYLGPFFPILVAIPSIMRFWYREWHYNKYHTNKGRYDDIWFEGTATESGRRFMNEIS